MKLAITLSITTIVTIIGFIIYMYKSSSVDVTNEYDLTGAGNNSVNKNYSGYGNYYGGANVFVPTDELSTKEKFADFTLKIELNDKKYRISAILRDQVTNVTTVLDWNSVLTIPMNSYFIVKYRKEPKSLFTENEVKLVHKKLKITKSKSEKPPKQDKSERNKPDSEVLKEKMLEIEKLKAEIEKLKAESEVLKAKAVDSLVAPTSVV